MKRCFDLAKKGGNEVKSNPCVGSIIVHNDRIIGEGFHQAYGEAHGEVNAINSVKDAHKILLPESTLYVSLEPCNHVGKTPPCVNKILQSGIRKVNISALDPNPLMQGSSIKALESFGVRVKSGILQKEGEEILRRFLVNMNGLPYVTIKFAQSKDRFIGRYGQRMSISGKESQIFTHKLRAENDAILIGTNTAVEDNPKLTTRYYPGNNALRVVLDRNMRIPKKHDLLNDNNKTLIFTAQKGCKIENIHKDVISLLNWDLENILGELYQRNVRSVLVEGGSQIIKWFSKEKLWHEAFVLTSNTEVQNGVKAPRIKGKLRKSMKIGGDLLKHVISN